MDRKEIAKKYKIDLPTSIDFTYKEEDKTLDIKLYEKGVLDNMQTNQSAFESWIFCLLPKIKNCETVTLDWDIPKNYNGHYHRFLYRVMKMKKHYDWFYIPTKDKEIEDFAGKYFYGNKSLLLNYPNKETKDIEEKSSECYFEQIFYHSELLQKKYGLHALNRQLPVGVFVSEIGKENYLFTGGKSAIDLWGSKGNHFFIFELKFNNKMVGILTETLFYSWIMEDLLINKTLKYPLISKQCFYRGVDTVINSIGKISNINSILLVDDLHKQITADVLDLINSSRNKHIKLGVCQYKPITFVELI